MMRPAIANAPRYSAPELAMMSTMEHYYAAKATAQLGSFTTADGFCLCDAGDISQLQAPGAAADGFKFPFRDTPFFVSAAKAADKLGFEPQHNIADDIAWYYQDNYVAQGGLEKELDFAADDATLGVAT